MDIQEKMEFASSKDLNPTKAKRAKIDSDQQKSVQSNGNNTVTQMPSSSSSQNNKSQESFSLSGREDALQKHVSLSHRSSKDAGQGVALGQHPVSAKYEKTSNHLEKTEVNKEAMNLFASEDLTVEEHCPNDIHGDCTATRKCMDASQRGLVAALPADQHMYANLSASDQQIRFVSKMAEILARDISFREQGQRINAQTLKCYAEWALTAFAEDPSVVMVHTVAVTHKLAAQGMWLANLAEEGITTYSNLAAVLMNVSALCSPANQPTDQTLFNKLGADLGAMETLRHKATANIRNLTDIQRHQCVIEAHLLRLAARGPALMGTPEEARSGFLGQMASGQAELARHLAVYGHVVVEHLEQVLTRITSEPIVNESPEVSDQIPDDDLQGGREVVNIAQPIQAQRGQKRKSSETRQVGMRKCEYCKLYMPTNSAKQKHWNARNESAPIGKDGKKPFLCPDSPKNLYFCPLTGCPGGVITGSGFSQR